MQHVIVYVILKFVAAVVKSRMRTVVVYVQAVQLVHKMPQEMKIVLVNALMNVLNIKFIFLTLIVVVNVILVLLAESRL